MADGIVQSSCRSACQGIVDVFVDDIGILMPCTTLRPPICTGTLFGMLRIAVPQVSHPPTLMTLIQESVERQAKVALIVSHLCGPGR